MPGSSRPGDADVRHAVFCEILQQARIFAPRDSQQQAIDGFPGFERQNDAPLVPFVFLDHVGDEAVASRLSWRERASDELSGSLPVRSGDKKDTNVVRSSARETLR